MLTNDLERQCFCFPVDNRSIQLTLLCWQGSLDRRFIQAKVRWESTWSQGQHLSFFRGATFFSGGETQTWPGLLFRLHVQASAAWCVHITYCHRQFVTECNANYQKLGSDVLIYIFPTNSGGNSPAPSQMTSLHDPKTAELTNTGLCSMCLG